MKCKKHPKYKALRRPQCDCVDCLKMWIDTIETENKELKKWREHWEAGAAERRWRALGGSW